VFLRRESLFDDTESLRMAEGVDESAWHPFTVFMLRSGRGGMCGGRCVHKTRRGRG